jgi:hypothetical protein
MEFYLYSWKIFHLDLLGLTPGQVGLVLVYMFQIMSLFQWTVRQSAEVENLVSKVNLKLIIT